MRIAATLLFSTLVATSHEAQILGEHWPHPKSAAWRSDLAPSGRRPELRLPEPGERDFPESSRCAIRANGRDNTGCASREWRIATDKGVVFGIATADLDGDGLLDIAVARSEAPSMVFFADTSKPK